MHMLRHLGAASLSLSLSLCLVLSLFLRANARELLEEIGETVVNPEGKDLSQFATKATMQAEMKAARSAGIEPEFTGEGTAFSTAVPDASKFACANKQIPPEAKEMFAAINANQWAEGEHCGECVEVWCEDAFCPTRFKPQVLKVYDLCPECADGDLDLSNEAYEKVTGRWPHRVKIAWRWLSRDECNAHFDPGNEIRMDLKDSHNKYYRGFFFSMAADRIASVKLDGRELTPSQFGFWEDFSGAELESGPHHLEFTSASGETIETTVDDVLKPTQWLKLQFGLKK